MSKRKKASNLDEKNIKKIESNEEEGKDLFMKSFVKKTINKKNDTITIVETGAEDYDKIIGIKKKEIGTKKKEEEEEKFYPLSKFGVKKLIEINGNLVYGEDFDIVEVYDNNENGRDKKIKIVDSNLSKKIIEKDIKKFSLKNLKTKINANNDKPYYRIILENNDLKSKGGETELRAE